MHLVSGVGAVGPVVKLLLLAFILMLLNAAPLLAYDR
jgi:hypothetical protein